jgi:hypothetical protein
MTECKKEEIVSLIQKKLFFFEDVLIQTMLHIQRTKDFNIINVNDMNNFYNMLNELNRKVKELNNMIVNNTNTNTNTDNLVNKLQDINNELSILFKLVGTHSFEDLLVICLGNNSLNIFNQSIKFNLLKKYFHPTSYRLLKTKEENDIELKNLDCIDIDIKLKNFHLNVYGIQVVISENNKNIIIMGYLDDININFIKNNFITSKEELIKNNIPNSLEFNNNKNKFNNFIKSLNLKDYLINEPHEIYLKYMGYLNNLNNIKQKTLSQVIKEFTNSDLYSKRNTIIQLLIEDNKRDNEYLVHLLYDLLSNENNNVSLEQNIIYNSLPFNLKKYLKDAIKNTLEYTSELTNQDINKVSIEQQICLLQVNDNVKEKAIQKLKEIKNKPEDSGTKARQYLEGLLKIPFNIYKREPILNSMNNIKLLFNNLIKNNNIKIIENKDNYTCLEILNNLKLIKNNDNYSNWDIDIDAIKKNLLMLDKKTLITDINKINKVIINNNLNINKIKYSNKNKSQLLSEINIFINFILNENKDNKILLKDLFTCIKKIDNDNTIILQEIDKIEYEYHKIGSYIKDVREILDDSVYGHDNAKKQVERIISQWITGNNNMGHIFGFEGNPGIGKTSLAKGLSNCLKDENGISRPFAFIAIGGDANSSTLIGHNYTYVSSTWGSIVQILMDKKCMNPIILIDEVDKISRTEHGKEIIGVLTHLLDTTQNDCFQDKYFSGIDLDLSKAIFILSYNEPELIDKILLDRIHRIKFDSLSIEDKIIISNNYLLPEIYKKVGLENMINISDEVIRYIIEEYTLEPGVRKLKEKLYEIIGEINLNILKKSLIKEYTIPIKVTIEDIKHKYLKHLRENTVLKIHSSNVNNIVNGMWANSYNQGGIIQFQVCFAPAKSFLDIMLTGNQKDVMKEGMILSRNIAWNLTSYNKQKELIKKYNDVNDNCIYGINIHAGDLSTPKDGPSASSTIVVLLYALFNNIKIKHYFAMTGEICFDGKITEIGGLESKIIGSIKNGVKEIIFPQENIYDFNKFMKKYKDNKIIQDIKFHPVNNIYEVFDLIYDN